MIDQSGIFVNIQEQNIQNELATGLTVEGGKVLITRLLSLFNLRNKVELSGIVGVSTGSLATWQTRGTVPYELLVRVHLSTGVPLSHLLFDEIKGDLRVFQYCENQEETPNYATINQRISELHYPLSNPPNYQGGTEVIDRLRTLFGLSTYSQLGQLCDISISSLNTWKIRKITPFELLCRIHLATGVSMHYLCFGKEWESPEDKQHAINEPAQDYTANTSTACTNTRLLDNGILNHSDNYIANDVMWSNIGITPESDAVVISNNKSYFIDKSASTVSKGLYLFSVNDVFQIGELKQLPDGKTYFYDDGEKYPINEDTTKIHGKVVSILEKI